MIDARRPWLAQRAASTPDTPAIHFGDASMSWRELADEALAAAAALAAMGVGRGDLVAVRMLPHPRLVALLHAAQDLGAALFPLNLRLAGAELQRQLEIARPRLLLDDAACGAAVAWPRSFDVHGDLPRPAARKSFTSAARIDPAAALTIVATSGTTSGPKCAVLSSANHAASAAASSARLGHGPGDCWLATLPLFHVGGLAILVRSVLDGSPIRLEARFDDALAARCIEDGSATMISLVPTMLDAVLSKLAGRPSSKLRCVLVGGAALAPELGRRALEAGLPVSATYGMTEACSQACSSAPGSNAAAAGGVGLPLDGVELRIDASEADGSGEILLRGPTVMRGYLGDDEATGRALQDGWLHTGDLGRKDAAGALQVIGRRDEMIVSGGENIAPLEVERVLDAHPEVVESLVVGVGDAKWGSRLVAMVVAPGGRLDSGTLIEWCRPRIAGYKIPREVRFVDALPRTATGKLLRRAPD